MYIDSVTGTLQSLNDTAGTLARMKDATVQNKIRQAELLNRMGENQAAEEMFNQAQHYGLSSLFAPGTQAWQAAGAFGDSPEPVQLKALNTLSGAMNPGATDISALDGNAATGISTKGIDKLTNKEVAKLESYQKQEDAANKPITDYNREAQAYNASIPQFRSSYEGDEPDQLNQLADDTMAAIKFAESQGDYQAAAAAYNKYVQTGRAIADHYQHQFKPLGSEYFFSPKKGGGGGTGEKGEKYVYGDDPLTAQTIHIPDYVYNKGEKAIESYIEKTWPSIYKKGTRIKRAGTNQSDDYDAVKDAQAKKLQDENSLTSNSAWEALVDKYDNIVTSRAKAREKALAELKSQGKDVRMDQYGRYVIIDAAGNNRNVVQSKPEDEVTF